MVPWFAVAQASSDAPAMYSRIIAMGRIATVLVPSSAMTFGWRRRIVTSISCNDIPAGLYPRSPLPTPFRKHLAERCKPGQTPVAQRCPRRRAVV